MHLTILYFVFSGVTRGGRTAPGDTLQGVTPKLKMWLNLQRTVDKRGRTGKKVLGDTLHGGDTRVTSKK